MNRLYIDCGSSRVKWGLFGRGCWLARGAHSDLEEIKAAWKHLEAASAIGSNVAGRALQESLESLRPDLEFSWIESKPDQCGVKNGYERPAQLGSDRWAALIAARPHLPEGGLVVDLGTAATIDILDREGAFEGGVILPGFSAMKEAIERKTVLKNDEGHFSFPPKNTSDAMHAGAIAALCGAVEKISRMTGLDRCVATGGDAEFVLPHLDMNAIMVDNLVLEGLVLISGDGA